MISFFFFTLFSASEKKEKKKMGYAKPLTESYFNKFIENRKNKKEIWAVMLHTEGNKDSETLFPNFIKASNLADGIFKFGIIETKKTPLLARKFVIKSVPAFFVFHENGKTEYTGDCDPSDLIDFCSQFLNDYSEDFDEKWVSNTSHVKASAVLFTERKETPNLWVGLSTFYHNNRRIKIGITKSEEMFEKYGVHMPPSIIFMNKTMNYTYKGKIEFRAISREFNNFIDGKLRIAGEIPAEVLDSTEFTKHCIGGVNTCILYTKGTDGMGWSRLHEKYESMNMIWFSGHKELPYKFLKSGNFWVYNPTSESLIKIDKMSDVGPVLERILQGKEIWTRVDDYLKQEKTENNNEL